METYTGETRIPLWLFYIPDVERYEPTCALPGLGSTPDEARRRAVYTGIPGWLWNTGTTVRYSYYAPLTLYRQALCALQIPCAVCGGPPHDPEMACFDPATGHPLPAFHAVALAWHQAGCPPRLENGTELPIPPFPRHSQFRKKRRPLTPPSAAASETPRAYSTAQKRGSARRR